MKLTILTAKQSTSVNLNGILIRDQMNTKNCDYEKNEIVKHCSEEDYNFIRDEKKAIDGESRLVPKRI